MKEKIRKKLSKKDNASIEFEILLNHYMKIQETDAAYNCFKDGRDYQRLTPEQKELELNNLFV